MPSCVVVLRQAHHCRRSAERPLIGRLMGIGILTASFTIASPAQAQTRSCPKWEPLAAQYGLPVKWSSGIAWRESRCNPKAVSKLNANGTRDYGIWQINSSWMSVTQAVCKTKNHRVALLNPVCNAKVAGWLYARGGKHHWRGTSAK